MAKKETQAPESMEATTMAAETLGTGVKEPAPDEAKNPSRIYCYIGPNLAGLMQSGKVFRGTRAEVLKEAAEAIEKYPLVKTMIVSGEELALSRMKVKTPGNALYKNYQRIAASREGK